MQFNTLANKYVMPLCLITGEGQYGKVYTCINVDTGELMAMKEVCASCSWNSIVLKDQSDC